MMTVDEMKALRKNVDADEFEHRLRLHCNELFDLNENGFFDGFELIGSELRENVFVYDSDDEQDVIMYRCRTCDGLYEYGITVSFDGSVMYGRKMVNVFRNARFGDKFVTDKGDVLIYGRRMETVENRVYVDRGMAVHVMMGDDEIYYVYESGDFVGAGGYSRHCSIVGRLSDDDLDIVKAYVKKELRDKRVGGYMQGFIDGYINCVIG